MYKYFYVTNSYMEAKIIALIVLGLFVVLIFHKYMNEPKKKETFSGKLSINNANYVKPSPIFNQWRTDSFDYNKALISGTGGLQYPDNRSKYFKKSQIPKPLFDQVDAKVGETVLNEQIDPNWCDKPIQSHKDFQRDFFGFRDSKTNWNTSIEYDPVDAINNSVLFNEYDGVKIKDIYDNMTYGTTVYPRR